MSGISGSGPSVGRWLARAWWLLVLSALGVAVVAWTYWRTGEPRIPHSSALNAAFDSRLLIAGARVLVGAGIGYLLLSIGVRVRRGHWVRNAGPFQADSSRSTQEVADSQQQLLRDAQDARRQIEDLQARLSRSLDAQRDLLAIIDTSPRRAWRRQLRKGRSEP